MARDTRPSRVASVMHELPFMRTADPEVNYARAVQLHGVLSTAREAAQRYRDAVAAHPDLAERLRKTCHYERPDQWNGYVPPRTDGYGAYNGSPIRAAIVEIVTEALTRQDDWRHYDSDRLATVPPSKIAAPWTEPRGGTQPGEAGLWHEA